MNNLFKSTNISVSINRNIDEVFEFVSNPENTPKYGLIFCPAIKKVDDHWIITTPQGEVKVVYKINKEARTIDQYTELPDGNKLFIPTRVFQNNSGSEFIITLFKPDYASDDEFDFWINGVKTELGILKRLLESK